MVAGLRLFIGSIDKVVSREAYRRRLASAQMRMLHVVSAKDKA